jgi:Tfp pilus assembly protein PilO
MSEKNKYQILITGVLLLGICILKTELADRWVHTLQHYKEFSDAKSQVLSPEELDQNKKELTVQKSVLTAQLTGGKGPYEQNQIGVIKLLHISARGANLIIRSLTPLDSKSYGQLIEHGFRIELVGTYHSLGRFINALETGPIPIQIIKMDMTSQLPGAAAIVINLDGKAFVFSKETGK